MSFTGRRLWSRLSNLSWDEGATRVRQEITKRLDVTLYRFGLQSGRNGVGEVAGARGNFFFSKDEIPQRVRLLRELLPQQSAAVVDEANDICRHRFRLLGYRDLDYGKEIDWHLDAVHGLRSPLIPWFKIDFLDFSQVGDHKVVWELSRHQHLVTLAKACLLTGDYAYAKEAIAQWYSWQRANPYPLGANWASSLEVAFRSLSWIWLHHLLAGCPVAPNAFHQDLVRALALNGSHIHRYLSTYFSPNTHLLGEAVALFFIGTLYPETSSASAWTSEGWRIVQEESIRQVRPDGIYFEQSLYYHVYALDFFLHARLLASRNGIEVTPEFDLVLRRMLSAIHVLARCGRADSFGDDDGGRLFNPARNHPEHLTDPLIMGAALFHDENLHAHATLTEESIWLFGEKTLLNDSRPEKPPVLNSKAFTDSGIYVVVTSDPSQQQMVIDAGPQGTGRSGHGHADALSIKLAFGGRPWLVDAGTFCYIGPGDERNIFRGTRAHNTLAVDGLNQAEPDGPFAWNSLPNVQAEVWTAESTFALFAGSHSGYERLREPVRHRRFVLQLPGSFWLVRDVAHGAGTHLLESSWHFAPDLQVSHHGDKFVAAVSEPSLNSPSLNPVSSAHLTLIPASDSQWKSELLSEHISPVYGVKVEAPVVRCKARTELPAEHAVILVPAVGGIGKTGDFLRESLRGPEVGEPEAAYRYTLGDTFHVVIFGRSQPTPWKFGPWASDAKLLYFCVKDRRVEHVLFFEGSFIQLREESVIRHDAPLQWLEWSSRSGQQRLASSDKAAERSFSAGVLGSEIQI